MAARLPQGTLIVCVDIDIPAAPMFNSPLAVDSAVLRLIDTLAPRGIPATWALADVERATATLIARNQSHEIALIADRSWAGRDATRSQFARQLALQTALARKAGINLSTLVYSAAETPEHTDLTLKYGISAVRHAGQRSGDASAGSGLPLALRFGLWSFADSLSLPGNRRWLPARGDRRAATTLIDRAIAMRGVCVLAISMTRLSVSGTAAQQAIERVLDHAQVCRQNSGLEIATVATTVKWLACAGQAKPSRSILRSAA